MLSIGWFDSTKNPFSQFDKQWTFNFNQLSWGLKHEQIAPLRPLQSQFYKIKTASLVQIDYLIKI